MTEARGPRHIVGEEGPHLSEDEIDLYVARRLPAERQAALEAHYLDCEDCRERVADLDALARGLAEARARPARAALPWLAAAALAAACLGLLLERSRPHAAAPASAAEVRSPAAPPRLARAALRPVERGAALQSIAIPAGTEIVALAADVAELAPPGTRVDVALLLPDGRPAARFEGLAVSAAGEVLVALPAALVPEGRHLLEARSGGDALRLPFEVVR